MSDDIEILDDFEDFVEDNIPEVVETSCEAEASIEIEPLKEVETPKVNIDVDDLEEKKKLYYALKKKSKKTKRFAILMFFMLLSVNAYAWFIYISESRFDLTANIVSWDVNFLKDSQEVSEVYENIEDVAPGMIPYSKVIKITNNSDFNAVFKYDLTDFIIMGRSAMPSNHENMTTAEIITYLSERYPFDFLMDATTDIISQNQSGQFSISFGWGYEDTSKYYKLTNIYKFNASFDYYRLKDGVYVIDESITAANYNQHLSSLYLYKDDADSFFGMECPVYVGGNTSRTCVGYKAYLIVEQDEAEQQLGE